LEIERYYVTFGVQYGTDPERHELHPLDMTGRGYAVIEAPSYGIARGITTGIFGTEWAFIYEEAEFHDDGKSAKWYPDGELLRIKWVDRNTTTETVDEALHQQSRELHHFETEQILAAVTAATTMEDVQKALGQS